MPNAVRKYLRYVSQAGLDTCNPCWISTPIYRLSIPDRRKNHVKCFFHNDRTPQSFVYTTSFIPSAKQEAVSTNFMKS